MWRFISPLKVYYTNGTKTGKKTVVFDKSFGQSEERSVAVASKKIYDVTKITVNIEKTDYDEYGNRIVISSKKYKEGKSIR